MRVAGAQGGDLANLIGLDRDAALDLFDRVQPEAAMRICHKLRTRAARRCSVALLERSAVVANHADRMRTYLATHGLNCEA